MRTRANMRIAWSEMAGRELQIRAALAELIARAALKQKVLAKADLRAAWKSFKHAKKVAKREETKARIAAEEARLK
jgi:hypothetical protein